MPTQSCSNCLYSLPDDAQFLCRRYPPVACIVMAPNHLRQLSPTSMSALPSVPAAGWCGEWSEQPPAIQLAN